MPGPAEVRRRLIDLATAHQPPYRVSKRGTVENQKWKSIFSRRLLSRDDYEDGTLAAIETRIRERWDQFVNDDLSALIAPIHAAVSSDKGP